MNILECPFGCSHHVFPDHFNFCPYCGSKLVRGNEIHNHILELDLSVNKSKNGPLVGTPES